MGEDKFARGGNLWGQKKLGEGQWAKLGRGGGIALSNPRRITTVNTWWKEFVVKVMHIVIWSQSYMYVIKTRWWHFL